jgi:ubiquitin C-terminal hydrolase
MLSLPKFLFIDLPRTICKPDYTEKYRSKFAFPLILDMKCYTLEKNVPHRRQLVGVVAHSGELQQNKGHYISFLNISGLMTIQSSLSRKTSPKQSRLIQLP